MTGPVLFLPGARGAGSFWRPVAELLPSDWEMRLLSWPGLGSEPADPAVASIDDLVGLVERELRPTTDLVAQSMGGVVAVRAALRRPETIGRIVLVATSGGIDVGRLGAADWRSGFRRANPGAAWLTEDRRDHSDELHLITAPVLLLWGDADPISPVAVGEHLASLLPNVRLEIVAGGDHSLAVEHAGEVAAAIEAHLRREHDEPDARNRSGGSAPAER